MFSKLASRTLPQLTRLGLYSHWKQSSSTSSFGRLHSFLSRATSLRSLPPSFQLATWPKSTSRVRTVAVTITFLGVGYMGWERYNSHFTSISTKAWPKEVTYHLRAGLDAKDEAEFKLSEQHLLRALEIALSYPIDSGAPEPYLKLSGIVLHLGDVLESQSRPEAAYQIYASLLRNMRSDPKLSDTERILAIELASYLGILAYHCRLPFEEEESWLVYAAEEMLRLVRDSRSGETLVGPEDVLHDTQHIFFSGVEPPTWLHSIEVLSPCSALASFYLRNGQFKYAQNVYASALATLIPIMMPNGPNDIPLFQFRYAIGPLLCNLACTLVHGRYTDQQHNQGELLTRAALDVLRDPTDQKRHTYGLDEDRFSRLCQEAYATTLLNLGLYRWRVGDKKGARECYLESWDLSIQMKDRRRALKAEEFLQNIDKEQPSGTVGTAEDFD